MCRSRLFFSLWLSAVSFALSTAACGRTSVGILPSIVELPDGEVDGDADDDLSDGGGVLAAAPRVDPGFPMLIDLGFVPGPLTLPAFTTPGPDRLVVVFIAFGTNMENLDSLTLSGAGLSWTSVGRSYRVGDALADAWYAWVAVAGTYSGVTINSPASLGGAVIMMSFADAAESPGVAVPRTGSASIVSIPALSTSGNPSLVYAVAVDWNRGQARTLDANSTMVHEFVLPPLVNGSTNWLQTLTVPPGPGTYAIGTTAPASTDIWVMLAVEIPPR